MEQDTLFVTWKYYRGFINEKRRDDKYIQTDIDPIPTLMLD